MDGRLSAVETSRTNLRQDLAITAHETLGKRRPDNRKGSQPGREHRVNTVVRDPSQYSPPYILLLFRWLVFELNVKQILMSFDSLVEVRIV